jgi:hypothetical protein
MRRVFETRRFAFVTAGFYPGVYDRARVWHRRTFGYETMTPRFTLAAKQKRYR